MWYIVAEAGSTGIVCTPIHNYTTTYSLRKNTYIHTTLIINT